jgi:hypothetical protein
MCVWVYIQTTGDWTSNATTLPVFKEKCGSPYTSHPFNPNKAKPRVNTVTSVTGNLNQERYSQCAYNVTLKRVLATFFAVEKQ